MVSAVQIALKMIGCSVLLSEGRWICVLCRNVGPKTMWLIKALLMPFTG